MEKLGVFILDGVEYEEIPSSFELQSDEYGLRSTSHRLLQGHRVVSTETAHDVGTYTHLRRILVQAWKADWNDDGSHMGVDLRNHLERLYHTQEPVWIRLDDEMSRCYGKCTPGNKAFQRNEEAKPYFTPTYPIFPYGWDGQTTTINDFEPEDLIVQGRIYSGDWEVDNETGLVLIAPTARKFTDTTKVHFRYTWGAYVFVKEFDASPSQFAQEWYIGSAVFEQVPWPL
jgi:hypothetical protein